MDHLATFVINLDRDTARLKDTAAALDQVGLTFTRIPAILGTELEIDQSPPLADMGRALLPGEAGCFQSHILAAQRFLASEASLGLVLEDDVALHPETRACIDALIEARDRFTLWDVMNLGRAPKRWKTPVRPAVWAGPGTLYHAHYFPVTTTALLWSRGGARAFLMANSVMRQPVDVQLQGWVARTGRGLAFDHPPFGVRDAGSTISAAGRAKTERARGYTKIRLHRIWRTHLAALEHKYRSGYPT